MENGRFRLYMIDDDIGSLILIGETLLYPYTQYNVDIYVYSWYITGKLVLLSLGSQQRVTVMANGCSNNVIHASTRNRDTPITSLPYPL